MALLTAVHEKMEVEILRDHLSWLGEMCDKLNLDIDDVLSFIMKGAIDNFLETHSYLAFLAETRNEK